MLYPHFIDGSYRPESVVADCEESINLFFARMAVEGAKSQAALYGTPGVRQKALHANTPGRGYVAIGGGKVFAVIGTDLIEQLQNGTLVWRGSVAIDGNPATLTPNGDGGNQLFVTSGYKGYILDLVTNVFTEVLSSGASAGGYMSGYFVAFDRPNSLFAISDLFDGLTWDPTQFAQNTMSPDPWFQMVVNGYSEAWLIGQFNTQVWIDTGADPFPLAPRQGLLIPSGTVAPWSAITFDSVVMWIQNTPAGTGVVVEANGYSPATISDDALTHELGTYTRIDDAEGWAYQLDGHLFYVLSFPSADRTWVYDRTTGKWHKWLSYDTVQGEYHRARVHWHAHEWNTHFVLDNQGGGVYELSSAFGLDVDEMPIVRQRTAPSLNDENKLIFYKSFELLIDSGLGTVTPGNGFNPTVRLETSNDAGRSFSNGREKTAGKAGRFRTRLKWERLGSARDRAYRVTFSAPTPLRILNAWQTIGQGNQNEVG